MRKYVSVFVLPFLIGGGAQADSLPLWELGVGAGLLRLPAYRGANGADNFILPIPFLRYRGERFRAEEDGLRGKVLATHRTELDFSLGGNLPVYTDDDSARQGMDDLDPLIEIGPSLEISLWQTPDHDQQLWLKVPARAAISIGEPVFGYQGIVVSPFLEYRKRGELNGYTWRFETELGVLFGNRRYHEYFYGVPSEHVTRDRPEYRSVSGYSGTRLSLSYSVNLDDYWIGAFVRYDTLQGAVFMGSPLVERDDYFITGIAFTWLFARSEERVED